MFDELSRQNLKYYVYMLLDPRDNLPFYVGKGIDNRVFAHLACALDDMETSTVKYDRIRAIVSEGLKVNHVIIRHGLTEDVAFQMEATIIDTLSYCGMKLSNIMGGHNSAERGLMTCDEIRRLYNAERLDDMAADCLLININKSYQQAVGENRIYQATKETWLISEARVQSIKYVLSEFRGLIVEVFEVERWYSKERTKNKTIDKERNKKKVITVKGFGFDGKVAPDAVRSLYINKSVAHLKQQGAAQVIRYNLRPKNELATKVETEMA